MEPQTVPQNQATTDSQHENVPSTWPGAFGIYKHSRNAVMLNIWPILGLGAIYFLVSIIFSSPSNDRSAEAAVSHPTSFITFLVSILLSTAFTFLIIAGVRGSKMSIGDALKQSLPLYLKALGLSLLTMLIAVISLILFIIPFFIVMPRLELATYFLVDQKLGPIDALKASWNATKGNVGKVWGIYGATLVFGLLILVLVGIYFTLMYAASSAVLYAYLTGTGQRAAPPEDALFPTAPKAPTE